MHRNLANFQSNDKMRIWMKIKYVIFHFINDFFFSMIPVTSRVRVSLLRLCGAKIGNHVLFKQRIRIHFPWNLEIGDNCWIGEEVIFINHEKIYVGSNVCISQRAMICSSGHDYRSASLEYMHNPITIRDGAWVCLGALVLPGVTIGECSVVSAGEVVRKSLPDFSMLVGGEIRPIQPPK